MTNKQLRTLRRAELLELLLEQAKENEHLRQENEALRSQLERREIAVQEIGSIAEAALKLNGVFEAAQKACDQYTYNVQLRCQQMEEETERVCTQMLEQMKQGMENVWKRRE